MTDKDKDTLSPISLHDDDIESKSPLARRTFLLGMIGGASVLTGCVTTTTQPVAGARPTPTQPARPRVTDRDTGRITDPVGRGRGPRLAAPSGVTDRDSGRNADRARHGRGTSGQARAATQRPVSDPAAQAFFQNNYSVRITSRNDSAIRPFSSAGLLGSSAGSCRDVNRSVEIASRTGAAPPRPIRVTIRWTLRRTYQPIGIREEGDPLHRERSYVLSAGNSRATDTIQYSCVPTSQRLHNAALSLLGAVAGASPGESGVNITLVNTDFGFEVVRVEWA